MALPKLNVPKYELKLPSTGFSVSYRPYLVKEEKVLMIAMESEDANQMTTAILDIIDTCTFNELNMSSLTMFDIEYIFAKLRSKSVGETSTVNAKCSKCEEGTKVDIDIDTVSITDIPDKKIQLSDSVGLLMKFPSMADYMDIQNSDASNIDKIFATVAASIDSIYSGDDMFEAADSTKAELIDFLESLNAEQFKKIQHFLNAMPVAYVHMEFKCEHCGHANETDLKGLMNFFG